MLITQIITMLQRKSGRKPRKKLKTTKIMRYAMKYRFGLMGQGL